MRLVLFILGKKEDVFKDYEDMSPLLECVSKKVELFNKLKALEKTVAPKALNEF